MIKPYRHIGIACFVYSFVIFSEDPGYAQISGIYVPGEITQFC